MAFGGLLVVAVALLLGVIEPRAAASHAGGELGPALLGVQLGG